MTRKLFLTAAIAALPLLFGACKKDKDNKPSGGSREVKYELTGNYSGKLMVSYTNAGGAQQLETDVTLPWSKTVTVAGSGVTPVGLLANSMTTGFGAAGQAVSGKIIVGGSTKANATVNTTAQGYMSFGPLHHNLGQ